MNKDNSFVLYEGEEKHLKEFCNCGSILELQKSFAKKYFSEIDDYYPIETFKILYCLACNSTTVVLYYALGNTNDDDDRAIRRYNGPVEYKYTRSVLYAPEKEFHLSVPFSVSKMLNQAEAVLVHSSKASFMLCRAALEEICNEFEIPSSVVNKKGKSYFVNLKDRLSQLFEKKSLSEDLQSIINDMRELGNEGVHADYFYLRKHVKRRDAESLIALTNYVVERLYIDEARKLEAVETLEEIKNKIAASKK